MNPIWLLGRPLLELTLSLAGRALRGPAPDPGDDTGSRYLLLAAAAAGLLVAAPAVLYGLLLAGLPASGG